MTGDLTIKTDCYRRLSHRLCLELWNRYLFGPGIHYFKTILEFAILLYGHQCFMCIYVSASNTHDLMPLDVREECSSLELQLQIVAEHFIDIRNWAQALCKSKNTLYLLNDFPNFVSLYSFSLTKSKENHDNIF